MIKPGLQRISRLLYNVPLPWRAIHVAGTNGKGSVCAFISEMLNAYNKSEYRTIKRHPMIKHGRFTSPHLIHRRDCIQLSNGDRMEVVSKGLFKDVEMAVARRSKHDIDASEFEQLTATAFEIFTKSKLDIGVVEVGMGGELDSTNIIGQPLQEPHLDPRFDSDSYRPRPLATVITRIGKDHQSFLGATYESIARHKAGIIKPKVPVICYQDQDAAGVLRVIQEHAKRQSAPMIGYDSLHLSNTFGPFPASAQTPRNQNGQLAFIGAWSSLVQLGRLPAIPHECKTEDYKALHDLYRSMLDIIQTYSFPGRQELVSLQALIPDRVETVLLDGAHNAQGIEALAQRITSMRSQDPQQHITYVVSISKSADRDSSDILRPLLQPGDNFFAVQFGPIDGMPWVEPQLSAAIASEAKRVQPELGVVEDYGSHISKALRKAAKVAGGGDLVVCGSLYLVGHVHRLLKGIEKIPIDKRPRQKATLKIH